MSTSGGLPTLQIEVRDPSRMEEAEGVGRQLGIPLVSPGRVPPEHLHLVYLPDAVELWDHRCVRHGTRIDFTRIDTRTSSGNTSKKQPLARAMGGHAKNIVDATAGFGHDAFLLACMGFNVTALERNPIIHLLLADAVDRVRDHPELKSTVQERFHLEYADAIDHLERVVPTPDTIYLDPMFEPIRSRSALPKKPAQLLRSLVGQDLDSKDLFQTAMTIAPRVVVKRADNDPPLSGTPNHSIKGKIVRYDVYSRS